MPRGGRYTDYRGCLRTFRASSMAEVLFIGLRFISYLVSQCAGAGIGTNQRLVLKPVRSPEERTQRPSRIGTSIEMRIDVTLLLRMRRSTYFDVRRRRVALRRGSPSTSCPKATRSEQSWVLPLVFHGAPLARPGVQRSEIRTCARPFVKTASQKGQSSKG